jgi:hypothetical protein
MPGPNPSRRPIACRHCGAALTTLQRLRGEHRDRVDCRRRAAAARLRAQREADLAATRAAAARRDATDAATHAPVVWLMQNSARLVPLPVARRRAHHEYLESLAAAIDSGVDEGTGMAALPPEATSPGARLGASLCGFCAGRCCRHGAIRNAFISDEVLRRWLAEHPGSRADDAVAQYMALLPRRHVEDSCAYHGREGCTLPRALRADICNRFACEPLVQVQHAVAGEPPQSTLLAAMESNSFRISRVALLQADGFRRVPLKRSRKRARKA